MQRIKLTYRFIITLAIHNLYLLILKVIHTLYFIINKYILMKHNLHIQRLPGFKGALIRSYDKSIHCRSFELSYRKQVLCRQWGSRCCW